jgi:hypothetical protein
VADKDDEREDRDSDAPEEKKQPAKKSSKESKAKQEPASLDDILVELREIKKVMHESQQGTAPHLWLLFPIAAAVLIQAIFMAMRL